MTTVSGLTSRNAVLTKYADTVYGDGPNGLVVDGVEPTYTSVELLSGSSQTGFFAAVYQYPGTDKFVIAFRGTDGMNDAGVNTALATGEWHPQFDNAIDFVAEVAKALGIPPSQIKDRIIVTGHSAGGAEAQIVGRLYGCDGATFDPAGGARQTQLDEFRLAAKRNLVDPAANQIPDTFRNYAVDGSVVPGGTGPHVGEMETVPQMAYPNLIDILKIAGLTALASNPLVMVLGVALTDQFGYKHPIGKIAETLNRLASMEDDPFVNPDGTEIRVMKLDDGTWKVYDHGGQDIGSFEIADGALKLNTAEGQLVQITKDGVVSYTTAQESGAQTLLIAANTFFNGPGNTLLDSLRLVQAIQNGEPLPVLSSGLRLANDLDGRTNPNLSGAANAVSGILSLMSLDAALEQGDTLGAITAGAQAISFGATAYADFAANSTLMADTYAEVVSSQLAYDGAQAFGSTVGRALPYLNLINSIENGDEAGTAVATLAVLESMGAFAAGGILASATMAAAVPVIGWIYAVYSIVSALMADNDIPDPWGNGKFVWDGHGITYQAAGETGGKEATENVMATVLNTLNSLIERARQQNPGASLGLIPNRMPSIGYDMSGYRYTDIDPLTGAEQHPALRFDTAGNPYNAEAGTPESYRSLVEGMLYSALDRGAIAPMWEVETAKLQTDAGDPQAGLTEEERAAMNGRLAAPITGSSRTFRPVVLDLDNDGIETTGTGQGVAFDVDDSGYLKQTAWVTGGDAFLTLDRDYNGETNTGKEMFSNSVVDISRRGLAGMAWVDSNYDGKLTSADPVWNELKVWRDDGDGVEEAGESSTLANLNITELNYAMGTFSQGGQVKQLASPDLAADKDGTRINVVPGGILVQSSTDGHLSLLVTRVDDRTAIEANRDGIPDGLEDVEVIVSGADLLANDSLGGFAGHDLAITGVSNFRHGTGFLDANGFVHFHPEANYAGSEVGFDYTVRAANGQEGTATVDITLQNVNDAPTLDHVDHTTQAVYGYTPVVYSANDDSGGGGQYVSGGNPIYTPYAIYSELDPEWRHVYTTVYHPAEGLPGHEYHTTPIAWEDTGTVLVAGADVDDPVATLRYELVNQPQYGEVAVNADGTFQYTSWKEPGIASDRILVNGQYAGYKDGVLYHPGNLPEQAPYPTSDVFQVRITDPQGASTIESISVPHYGPYLPPAPPGGGGKKPIAVDLNGNGFEFVNVDDSNVFFDVNGDGWKRRTAWVGKDDGLLAYDANGDGKIDKPGEIAFARYKEGAQSDLEGLAAFDSNRDGVFSAADEKWAQFGVWQDANQNGTTDPGEFQTLGQLGVTAVQLTSDGQFQVINGQTVHGVGAMTKADGSEIAIADVTLAYRNEVRTPSGTTTVASPFSPSGEELTGTEGKDLILGKSGNNIVKSLGGNDVVFEDGGNDLIDAGDGNDIVYAGADNDLVIAGNGDDIVYAGLGNDVVFGGDGHDAILADGGNDIVFGGAGNDLIAGGWGNDVLSGDAGDDQVYGEAGSDALFGRDGNDELMGMDGDDRLNGGAGNDLLDGGTGADAMTGGMGDDTYVVDNLGDTVTELAGEGIDTVHTALDGYALGANVENLTLTGTANLAGTGNDLHNILVGNQGVNALIGGLGDDTYVVQNEGDMVVENTGEGLDTVRSNVSHSLSANVENLMLTGTAAINGTGNDLDNVLTGDSGDNALDGSAGADTMIGGRGSDIYVVDNAGDVVVEQAGEGTDTVLASVSSVLSANVDNLTLTGTANLNGTGNELGNVLTGNAGHNVLDGGTGADTMIGSAGDDTYLVDNVDDFVVEHADEGVDTVRANVSYALATNVEDLALTGNADIDGVGNELANVLTGNGGNNVLDGKAGADMLIGGAGNDTYLVDDVADGVVEQADEGIDMVRSGVTHALAANVENLILTGTGDIDGTGNELANILTGNSGNNVLDGGTGADVLSGGLGNDTYVVDDVADQTLEAAGEGVDTVRASLSWSLAANIENLTLTGSDNVHGTGNELANVLTGNSGHNLLDGGTGADVLSGGLGDDTYVVDDAADQTLEAAEEGVDTVRASLSWSLAANLENLELAGTANLDGTGNELANVLTGNSGNNALDGGAGADRMMGGAGDDTYRVDNAADIVWEAAGAGIDSIYTAVSHVLPEDVENLYLVGDGNIGASGNGADNILIGNGGDNTLSGGRGNDTMDGRAGNDTYLINLGDGLDRIIDAAGNDTVRFGTGLSLDNVALRVTEDNGTYTAHVRVLNAGGCEHPDQGFDFAVSVDERGRYASPIERFEFADGSTKTFDDLLIKTRVIWARPWERSITTGRDDDIIFAGPRGDTIRSGSGNDIVFAASGGDTAYGEGGNDYLQGGTGDDTFDGGCGVDVLAGSNGRDVLCDLGGNNAFFGGRQDDQVEAAAGNDFIAGGAHDDLIAAGGGNNVVAYNRGDGRDTVLPGVGASNVLSLGGIADQDLAFRKVGQDLVLQTGGNNQVTFKDWYASAANQNFVTLQTVDAASSSVHGSGWEIERYDFKALVQQYDAARAANPSLSQWSLMNGLLNAHLAGSDSAALGGDLATRYAAGGESAISLGAAQTTLQDARFGTEAQTVGSRFDNSVSSYRIS